MSRFHVRGRIRRVGNGLALLLPSRYARTARLKAGQMVEAEIETETTSPLGLLSDLPYEEYSRRQERIDRDRI